MPLKKDLTEFSSLAREGAASLRNVVNEPELSAWLDAVATERLGLAGLDPEGAEPTREFKAREWLTKVARKHQLREGMSEEVGRGDASIPSSWSGLAWVHKALAERRTLSRLVLTHEERERIASVLDWMRSDDGPPTSGDWTRISFGQAVKAEHDWIEAKARAFAKKKQDGEASQGTMLFLDLSSLGAPWEGWRWVRVESAAALDREGALMRHCVGSYAEDVAEGHKEIYSLRDPQDKPKLTVEARGPVLAQLKGFANGVCPAEQRVAVGAFAAEFEKVADPDGLGLIELSEDVEQAGFASLPGLGVFPIELGLSPEQRTRWERRLSELVKFQEDGSGSRTGTDMECEKLAFSLAKIGLVREIGELLPFVDPKATHVQALSSAAEGDHKAIVEMLLPVSDPLANDSQALRLAAAYGHKDIVKMLLPVSDPLALDSGALRWAAKGGHRDIVEMLLPVSDPLACDSQALREAANNGHKDIVEMLLPVSDALAVDSYALREAASSGHKEIVEMLLPMSDPLARDSQALRSAAGAGHKEIVERLLPLSEPKALDSGALHNAARYGHKEIVEMLLPLSDPLARDSEALRIAAAYGHKEIVEMLLPMSDPLARDSQALRSAAGAGHKEIVEMLLPWSDALAGNSAALSCAAYAGHKEIVEMLLPLSDALVRESEALRCAAIGGHKEIVQMLAHSYCGDADTFYRLVKQAGMDASGFHVSTLGSDGDIQPTSGLVVEKIAGRRQKRLPQELARELSGRPHGT